MSVYKCSFSIYIIFYHMRPFNKTTATLVRPHPFSTLCPTPLGNSPVCRQYVPLSRHRSPVSTREHGHWSQLVFGVMGDGVMKGGCSLLQLRMCSGILNIGISHTVAWTEEKIDVNVNLHGLWELDPCPCLQGCWVAFSTACCAVCCICCICCPQQ